jgi:exonuclease III
MTSKIKIAYINTRGTTGKLDTLKQMIKKYDLLIVGESWLSQSSSTLNFSILDLRQNHREGLLVLSKTKLHKQIETVHIAADRRWFHIRYRGVHIISGYIPPSDDLSSLGPLWEYSEQLQTQEPTSPILVVGDFNARLRMFGDTLTNRRGTLFMTRFVPLYSRSI